MLLRLFWRSRMIVPDGPTSLPAAINLVSQLVHYVLYFGVILVAFLGWANAPSRGWPVKLFGFIPLPPIMPKGSDLGIDLAMFIIFSQRRSVRHRYPRCGGFVPHGQSQGPASTANDLALGPQSMMSLGSTFVDMSVSVASRLFRASLN